MIQKTRALPATRFRREPDLSERHVKPPKSFPRSKMTASSLELVYRVEMRETATKGKATYFLSLRADKIQLFDARDMDRPVPTISTSDIGIPVWRPRFDSSHLGVAIHCLRAFRIDENLVDRVDFDSLNFHE